MPRYSVNLREVLSDRTLYGIEPRHVKEIGLQIIKGLSGGHETKSGIEPDTHFWYTTVLHAIEIIHTDLKPEHIVLASAKTTKIFKIQHDGTFQSQVRYNFNLDNETFFAHVQLYPERTLFFTRENYRFWRSRTWH